MGLEALQSHLYSYSSVVVMTFFSCWRLRLNQTPSILHRLSFQLKGLGRAQPFHKPNHRLTDFLLLILAPIMTSYLLISLLTSTISALFVRSPLKSPAYAVYLATSVEPGNMRPCGFAFNLRKKCSSARVYSIGNSKLPRKIKEVKVKSLNLTPFAATMTPGDD